MMRVVLAPLLRRSVASVSGAVPFFRSGCGFVTASRNHSYHKGKQRSLSSCLPCAEFASHVTVTKKRFKSSAAGAPYYNNDNENSLALELHRLSHLRNVGILAHVDAGKTTVTERMLALTGVIDRAGSVDSGNTVTDYLPAERERGITIQSAAISFEWAWHNNRLKNSNVMIHLIDTPGHVDFSVEVNRSVAVLDGAILVVDAVAGAQAQTETVWRAITRPSMNNHSTNNAVQTCVGQDHGHEPLPCLAMINKMDKEGCSFGYAIKSLKYKLPGANPVAIQIPLFRIGRATVHDKTLGTLIAIPVHDLTSPPTGHFAGVVDLVHMRAVVWPDDVDFSSSVEECAPQIKSLLCNNVHHMECEVTKVALAARHDLIATLANVDERMEEYFLTEEEPSNAELGAAIRRATLARNILPVLAGAALRGKGVEPLLDAVADFLPSPLDRMAPALLRQSNVATSKRKQQHKNKSATQPIDEMAADERVMTSKQISLGHPLHPSLLALAFKVVHMKGRGGSGDGRVVFARVYSGKICARDSVKVISPRAPGELLEKKPRTERVGSMLELAGGRFDNLEDGVCHSGDVCALVGLKTVVTGDTLLLPSNSKNNKKGAANLDNVCLAGVASPKPVLTVRVEVESSEQQAKLSEALTLLSIEDPSLHVEESESATLLSGLGELHIEIVLDRLRREFGLTVWTGKPAVAYRETVQDTIETPGLFNYDRTIGTTRLQASIHLILEPFTCTDSVQFDSSSCTVLTDPIVTIGSQARAYLGFDEDATEEELSQRSEVVRALISACQGSLKRGSVGLYALANVRCHVINVEAEGGLAALNAMPGSIRAAASFAISSTLTKHKRSCSVLEPIMSVELTVPGELLGAVLSDLSARRGTVGEVVMSESEQQSPVHAKALVRGEVPLVEILGYANSLRSITGGEGAFTAEYKGHAPCDEAVLP